MGTAPTACAPCVRRTAPHRIECVSGLSAAGGRKGEGERGEWKTHLSSAFHAPVASGSMCRLEPERAGPHTIQRYGGRRRSPTCCERHGRFIRRSVVSGFCLVFALFAQLHTLSLQPHLEEVLCEVLGHRVVSPQPLAVGTVRERAVEHVQWRVVLCTAHGMGRGCCECVVKGVALVPCWWGERTCSAPSQSPTVRAHALRVAV